MENKLTFRGVGQSGELVDSAGNKFYSPNMVTPERELEVLICANGMVAVQQGANLSFSEDGQPIVIPSLPLASVIAPAVYAESMRARLDNMAAGKTGAERIPENDYSISNVVTGSLTDDLGNLESPLKYTCDSMKDSMKAHR